MSIDDKQKYFQFFKELADAWNSNIEAAKRATNQDKGSEA